MSFEGDEAGAALGLGAACCAKAEHPKQKMLARNGSVSFSMFIFMCPLSWATHLDFQGPGTLKTMKFRNATPD
jgi:hypothetical protein